MATVTIREVTAVGTSATLWGGLEVSCELEVHAPEFASFWPLTGQATLYVVDGEKERLIGNRSLMGLVGLAQKSPHALQRDATVIIGLDPPSLERLDEIRAGGNLRLRLAVRLGIEGLNVARVESRLEVFAKRDFQISKSDWAEQVLPAAEFDRYEIWEVRRLGAHSTVALQDEKARLRKAIGAFNHGNWKTAFVESREAAKGLRAKKDQIATDPKVLDKLTGFLSQAVHVEELPTDWEPSRPDAVLAISSTKACLDWAESLLAASAKA